MKIKCNSQEEFDLIISKTDDVHISSGESGEITAYINERGVVMIEIGEKVVSFELDLYIVTISSLRHFGTRTNLVLKNGLIVKIPDCVSYGVRQMYIK